jgi:hypothetical protein
VDFFMPEALPDRFTSEDAFPKEEPPARRIRYAPVPWLRLIFIFGFLPWSEVSCNAKEFQYRFTQSGT